MLFADDCYVYCAATISEAGYISDLLKEFQLASGQQVNFEKSLVFFSINTTLEVRNSICSLLHVSEANFGSYYLGLPNFLGKNKVVIFAFLKARLEQKLLSWESKMLSRAGKELLLKTVAQSLPCYAMSVFLLPLSICRDLENIMACFF